MKIVWDETKRMANRDKHGLDFAELASDFFLGAVVIPAKDGRFKAINRRDGRALTAIFSRLGSEAISIVSFRPAGSNERKVLS